MNFDRNTVIGFIVLALLFGGYFWWTSKEQSSCPGRKGKTGFYYKGHAPKTDTAALKTESAKNDSIAKIKDCGQLSKSHH